MRVRIIDDGFYISRIKGIDIERLLEKAKNIKSLDDFEELANKYGEAATLTAFNRTHNTLDINNMEECLENNFYDFLMRDYIESALEIEAKQEAAAI